MKLLKKINEKLKKKPKNQICPKAKPNQKKVKKSKQIQCKKINLKIT